MKKSDIINTGLTLQQLDYLNLIPSLLVKVEHIARCEEFKRMHSLDFIDTYLLTKCFYSKFIDHIVNYETLETIGDSVLKSIISFHIYK